MENWIARAILGIACALLVAHAAPSTRDYDSVVESTDTTPDGVDPLIEDDFYKEFPEVVNPSATSSKLAICLT